MTMLNIAQSVAMTPPNLSQLRDWVTMPGSVTTKVMKTRTALAIPAANGYQHFILMYTHNTVRTCQRKPLVQKISCCLPPVLGRFHPDILDDDGKREHEDAH